MKPAPRADHRSEPGFYAWKAPSFGCCAVCGVDGLLIRHHCVTENRVRREGGNPYDLRNALGLGAWCPCHRQHHSSAAKLPLSSVPPAAIAFAVELLGQDAAEAYMHRYYAA
jgi:hypothetical protein